MLYSCTHVAPLGVKGLTQCRLCVGTQATKAGHELKHLSLQQLT